MPNICHAIGTPTPKEDVLTALTTIEGLSSWWTRTTTGSTHQDQTIVFRFPDDGFDMKVRKSSEDEIEWECTGGPEEWIGTHIHFHIEETDEETALHFQHTGWAEESPFHHHCSMKWATFLLSLKAYLETGAGKPFPDDVKICAFN